MSDLVGLIDSDTIAYSEGAYNNIGSVDPSELTSIFINLDAEYINKTNTYTEFFKAYLDLSDVVGKGDPDDIVTIIESLGSTYIDSSGMYDYPQYIDDAAYFLNEMNNSIANAVSNRPITGLGLRNRRFTGRGLMKYSLDRTRRRI
jgi:hypothetical protein